ncbi:MAG TPA: hypothetical protein VII11_07860, partial [Bacteroidota bacterium]
MSARHSPVEMSPEEFRAAGHQLVDTIAEYLAEIRNLPLTRSENPSQIRKVLGRFRISARYSA